MALARAVDEDNWLPARRSVAVLIFLQML